MFSCTAIESGSVQYRPCGYTLIPPSGSPTYIKHLSACQVTVIIQRLFWLVHLLRQSEQSIYSFRLQRGHTLILQEAFNLAFCKNSTLSGVYRLHSPCSNLRSAAQHTTWQQITTVTYSKLPACCTPQVQTLKQVSHFNYSSNKMYVKYTSTQFRD